MHRALQATRRGDVDGRLARARAVRSGILQGAGRSRLRAATPSPAAAHVLLRRFAARRLHAPDHVGRPGDAMARRTARHQAAARARQRRQPSSAAAYSRSATRLCSSRVSFPTACAAASSMSTTTCRSAATRIARSSAPTTRCRPIFAELADKFVAFVDVLSEVSARTLLTSDADLLRLYEKWLRTGSRRDGDLLAERGIVPNASRPAHPVTAAVGARASEPRAARLVGCQGPA